MNTSNQGKGPRPRSASALLRANIRQRWIRTLLVAAWIGSAVSQIAAPPAPELPDFDRRDAIAQATRNRATATQRKAAERLQERLPAVQIAWHPVTGAPRWVAARDGFLTGPNGVGRGVTPSFRAQQRNEDPQRAVKAFVDEHAELFGHDSRALAAARTTRDDVAAPTGMRTTVWQQQHAGIDLFESVFLAHTTADGALIAVSSQFLPQLEAVAVGVGNPSLTPRLKAAEAMALACVNAGGITAVAGSFEPRTDPADAERRQFFRGPSLKGEGRARLVWLPLDESHLRLAWEIIVKPRGSAALFLSLVDAESGEIRLRRSLTSDLSNASYRVYTGDSPTPMSPGYAGPGETAQPATVTRTLHTLTALDVNASPEGWIPDGVNQTLGNNVDAHTDLDDDESPDLPRPAGSPSRVFDFALDLGQEPSGSSYRKAAVVNLFYWCNWIHDRLYQLGFTEGAGNFQQNNFGKGGLGGDRVLADAQDGGGTDNANFSTPPDGMSPRMQMYLWEGPTPDRDGDFDAEVIIHEYAHGLSGRLVGGGVGISQLQTKGMGEGWSDFYALALLSKAGDAVNGNYALGGYVKKDTVTQNGKTFGAPGDNYYFGIRRYPYTTDLTKNPLTFRDIDPDQFSTHSGIARSPVVGASASEVHNAGEIWCAMLWEARALFIAQHGFATGNELILQLVTDGMKLSPPNPTFVEARDAILLAEQALTGGANKDKLWTAFAKRGLGAEAIAPPNTTTSGVIEDFSPPDTLRLSPLGLVQVTGAYGGPFTWGNQAYTLSNTTASAIGWSASSDAPLVASSPGGTLSGQGKTTVTISLNAGAAATLPSGEHERLIRFSNHVSHVVHVRKVQFTVTEPLRLLPDNSLSSVEVLRGPEGGPFAPVWGPLVLTNRSALPMSWAALEPDLFSVTPSTGILGPLEKVSLAVEASSTAAFLPAAFYTNTIVFTNLTTTGVLQRDAELRVGDTGYATQFFGGSYNEPFDLAFSQATFFPDDSSAGYNICVGSASAFPVDPKNSQEMDKDYFGDYEEEEEIALTGGKQVMLFGVQTNRVWLGLEGFIALDTKDDYPLAHFRRLRASALLENVYAPYITDAGGRVSWQQLPDRFVATWENSVANHAVGRSTNDFQAELFFDGAVRFTWLDAHPNYAVVGLSRGTNTTGNLLPAHFLSTDLSGQTSCDALLPDLLLSAPKIVSEGQGVRFGQARVSVLMPEASPLVISLASSDPSEITLPLSVTLPAGATSAVFNITVVDDAILDGSNPVVLTASASFHNPGKHVLTVQDNESTTLHLTLPLVLDEGAGATGLVWTEAAPAENVAVLFGSSSNGTALAFPFFALLPAGATSAVFQYSAKDDGLITGTRYASLTASVANWNAATNGMLITDNEGTNLTILGPLFLGEADGGILTNIAQVVLSGALTTNLSVSLNTSGGGFFEYLAFGPVTIPAGQTNAFFDVFISDDLQIEPIESFLVTASAPGFGNGTWNPFVFDNDTPPTAMDPSPAHLAEDVPLNADLSWKRIEGDLIVNGGFEDAALAGWSRADWGGGGWVSANASHDPPGPGEAQLPLEGVRFALSQQYGNGRHELWQEVSIPSELVSAALSWSHRWENHASSWSSNQQFRVELRDTANHVLDQLFVSQPGQPLSSGWTEHTVNLNAWRGQTVRLVFVEIDELAALNVSLDNVRLIGTPPAPTTWQVYFGINPIPDGTGLLGSTTNTSWPLATLTPGTTYYWYVKSVRGGATNTGPVWQFKTSDSANLPPTLALSNPGNNAIVTAPVDLPISVGSYSDDGILSHVEFWADGFKIGEDSVAPYSQFWTNPPLGEHAIRAIAQDTLGARGTSVVQRVSIVPAGGMILQTLVPFGANWLYRDTGENLGTSWRSNAFRATDWPTGPAQLGYGEGDEATEIGYGDDPGEKHVTTYFRHDFSGLPGVQSLQLRVLRDDGVAVYLNGREALRNNLVARFQASTLASLEVTGTAETLLVVTNLAPTNFNLGAQNLIAAELHQASPSSVDLSFDLELAAVVNPLPSVALTSPINGSTFMSPDDLTLEATAFDSYGAVSQVEFFADGFSLGSANGTPYTLTWTNPPAGVHILRAVATDNLGATNLSAAITVSVVPQPPKLRIAYGFNRIFLTWPESSSGFDLETTTNLAAPIDWISASSTPFLQDGLWQVVLPFNPGDAQRFYRLTTP